MWVGLYARHVGHKDPTHNCRRELCRSHAVSPAVNSAKPWLIALLCLAGIGVAWREWNHQNEIAALRAAAIPRDERADFQKRVWELEKTNRELKRQLAAKGLAPAPGSRPQQGEGETVPRRGPDSAFAMIGNLAGNPEVRALVNLQQRGAIDSRYAALFRKLNLPPDQLEKLRTLLAERTATVQDIFAVAHEQGVNLANDPAAMGKLLLSTQDDINASLRTFLGDTGFTQLRAYEQTLSQRTVVDDLQQRLSYTAAPLTPAQADQLIDILATNPVPRATPATRKASAPPFGNSVTALFETLNFTAVATITPATITPAAVAQSQSVLSAPQVAALQQMQQQHQAQQQLRQMVTNPLGGAGGKK